MFFPLGAGILRKLPDEAFTRTIFDREMAVGHMHIQMIARCDDDVVPECQVTLRQWNDQTGEEQTHQFQLPTVPNYEHFAKTHWVDYVLKFYEANRDQMLTPDERAIFALLYRIQQGEIVTHHIIRGDEYDSDDYYEWDVTGKTILGPELMILLEYVRVGLLKDETPIPQGVVVHETRVIIADD